MYKIGGTTTPNTGDAVHAGVDAQLTDREARLRQENRELGRDLASGFSGRAPVPPGSPDPIVERNRQLGERIARVGIEEFRRQNDRELPPRYEEVPPPYQPGGSKKKRKKTKSKSKSKKGGKTNKRNKNKNRNKSRRNKKSKK